MNILKKKVILRYIAKVSLRGHYAEKETRVKS